MGRRFIGVLLLFASHLLLAGNDEGPAFKGSTSRVSKDGHVNLQWIATDRGAVYEIQQSATPDFDNSVSIYKGPDRATFISGLRNGKYYYRVREQGGAWSDILTLNVKHHSLKLAYALTGLGALVFLLTVLVVLRGTSETTVGD